MPSTALHFRNITTGPIREQILIFLKPIDASAVYKYAAWKVLNPGRNSNQTATITTDYSASARLFSDPDNDDEYTDPHPLPLGGKPVTVVNTGATSIEFGTPDPYAPSMTPNQVGVENATYGFKTGLTLKWYVNSDLVVESNNTNETQVPVGSTTTFELEQVIYVMLSQKPEKGPNYQLQTYSRCEAFVIPNSATDLYFEEYTEADGFTNRVRQVTKKDYLATIAAHAEMKRAMRLVNGTHNRQESDPAFEL